MRTNSKLVKDQVRKYILDCITIEGYELPSDTLPEKLQIIANEFKHAACYPNNLKRLHTYQNCFIDWLQGLPSCLSVEFYTNGILEIMENWGLPLPKNKTPMEGEYLFRYLIFRELNELCNKNNVPLY